MYTHTGNTTVSVCMPARPRILCGFGEMGARWTDCLDAPVLYLLYVGSKERCIHLLIEAEREKTDRERERKSHTTHTHKHRHIHRLSASGKHAATRRGNSHEQIIATEIHHDADHVSQPFRGCCLVPKFQSPRLTSRDTNQSLYSQSVH